MTPMSVAVSRFPSLEALRTAHAELLKRYRTAGDTPEMIAEVEAFIRQGRATGALLDAEADRWAAQAQLDYWATQLYRPGYEPPDATLDEFDPLLAPELNDQLCPYVGLDAFQEEDQNRFFGRVRLLDELMARLQSVRLLAVVGPSGSGKSSLVRAGLIPLLKKNGVPGSADWFYFTPLVPGSRPLANLAQWILPPEADGAQIQNEVEHFLRDAQHLAKLMRERSTTAVVLVVDQFEEVFTLCTDDLARQMFVANLITLSRQSDLEHRVIITMRADFVPNVARLPELQSVFEKGLVSVGPLMASELREAIEAPAALIGLKFEEGVVDALVNDTLGEPAALPLLQFTLLKLWENRERNRVTWEAYRRLGGGRLALAKTADEFYDRLIREEQVAVRRILLKMVRPGEGLEVTSNRVPRASLFYQAEATDRIERVLDKLIRARLVRVSDSNTADEQVEVAHEALVRNWPRLGEWLDEERSALRQRQRLTAAAEQWLRVDKDPSALWRGLLLEQARQYDDLNELETEFIQAGAQVEQALIAAEEARRQKELDDARKLAEVEAAHAREAEQAAARLRRSTRIIAALFIIAVVLGIAAAVLGVAAYDTANKNAALAEAARSSAEQEKNRALSREFATIALTQIISYPERGLLIALEAISVTDPTTPTYEAQNALRALLVASKVPFILPGHGSPVYSAGYSPDGRQIVTAGEDQTARLWDAATGQLVRELAGDKPLTNAQYSPDGKWIVTASDDQTARIWDAAMGNEVVKLRGHEGRVNSASFSPDGAQIVTAGADHTVRIWDAVTGAPINAWQKHDGAVNSAQYSPDGKQIVTASDDQTARIWDAATGKEVAKLSGHEGRVNSASFSPDGAQIVTAGDDQTVRIWDAATGNLVKVLLGHAGAVVSARYSPVGTQIVSASDDGTARIWDAATGQEIAALRGQDGVVYSAEYSPDGKRIVTTDKDGSVQIYFVQIEDVIALARMHVSGKQLTCEERVLYLHDDKNCLP